MKKNVMYVGLDVHKNTIEVAIAEDCAEGAVRSHGKINSSLEALNKLIRKIKAKGSKLQFVYEAGPCRYDVYRYLISKSHGCSVVAPSIVPRRKWDRIKTDRCKAINLVRLFRAGRLTIIYIPIYIPTEEGEGLRDLLRCRDIFGISNTKSGSGNLPFYSGTGLIIPTKTGPKDT